MSQIIFHIIGRTLHTVDEGTPLDVPPKRYSEYVIAQRATILLQGEKCKLADLKRGDTVIFGQSSIEGFLYIEAMRPETMSIPNESDHSVPKVMEMVDEPSGPVVENIHDHPKTTAPIRGKHEKKG